MLIEGWGDDGTAVEWQGRAIQGRVGWKGGLAGDAAWDVLLAERSRLTLRFPCGATRAFVVAYVSTEDGTVDVWGEGSLPETTDEPR